MINILLQNTFNYKSQNIVIGNIENTYDISMRGKTIKDNCDSPSAFVIPHEFAKELQNDTSEHELKIEPRDGGEHLLES